MALGHKLGGLKRTNWENKKPLQKVQTLKKHYENLGYKIPNYLQKDNISNSQFNKAIERITKGYETKIFKEKNYAKKKIPIDKKQLTNKLAKSINDLNKTIDKTTKMLRNLGYTEKQIEYLSGNPIYTTMRKKAYFKDNDLLEKEDINTLVNKTPQDIKNSIKRVKQKTKELQPKSYLKKITNAEIQDKFFEEFLNEEFMEDLNDIELNHLKQLWNKLSPQEKEIGIKSQLEQLREQYKNKYEKDWSDNTANNAYYKLINYLEGAKDTFN